MIQATAAWHHATAGRWRPAVALVGRVQAAWAPWAGQTQVQGFALAEALGALGLAAEAWAQGQAAPPPTWRFRTPAAAEFAPLVDQAAPPLAGHVWVWDQAAQA